VSKNLALAMLSFSLLFNVEFVLAERVKAYVKTEIALHSVGSGFIVNAQQILEGQSISVFRVSNEALKGAGMKYESQPIIRTFSATQVTDEINGEKSSDPVSYRDNYWCRFDVFSQNEKCYSIMVAALEFNRREVFEVESIDIVYGKVPYVNVIGRVEGLNVPEGMEPPAHSGTRRRPR
jgi:hypothetical protein